MRTARRTTVSTSWMTDPGRDRGVSEPSGSYARSAKPFRRDREPGGLPRANQLRRRQPEEDERRIERTDGARDRVGERAIPRRHVVERAVRLDVPEPHAFAVRDRRQRADLIEDQVLGRPAR